MWFYTTAMWIYTTAKVVSQCMTPFDALCILSLTSRCAIRHVAVRLLLSECVSLKTCELTKCQEAGKIWLPMYDY